MAKWIEFRQIQRDDESQRKTRRWEVVSKEQHSVLGDVYWYGTWRRYCFFPLAGTLFEEVCLRDIAAFCQEQTAAHKAKAVAPC